MNKKRKATSEFKSQVVLQLLLSEKSMAELCRKHQLTSQMIGNWKLIPQYSASQFSHW